ncbi:MAG: carboxymuconolactone decarboxylase family protein [Actinoallomurus sp.]
MRLSNLETGQRRPAKFFLLMASKASGAEIADVVKMFLYRPELFGRAMTELFAEAMRGPSFWTAGEREYIALCVARIYKIPYCIDIHTEMISIASTGEIDAADVDTARPELRAVLPFLEKVTRSPDSVSESDLAEARELGVPEEAVVEALHVAFIWNAIDRLAYAFDFQLLEGQLKKGTQALHQFKYRFPAFTLR